VLLLQIALIAVAVAVPGWCTADVTVAPSVIAQQRVGLWQLCSYNTDSSDLENCHLWEDVATIIQQSVPYQDLLNWARGFALSSGVLSLSGAVGMAVATLCPQRLDKALYDLVALFTGLGMLAAIATLTLFAVWKGKAMDHVNTNWNFTWNFAFYFWIGAIVLAIGSLFLWCPTRKTIPDDQGAEPVTAGGGSDNPLFPGPGDHKS